MIVFNFYFYELPNSFGHPVRIRRGIGVSDGPGGRYATYFHALAMSISKENAEEIVAAILKVERGHLPKYEFGVCGWVVHVDQHGVVFESEDYEDLNGEGLGSFTFAEFKWVLMAWWEFLLLPDLYDDPQYSFALPVDTPCLLDKPDSLLKPVRGNRGSV